MSTDEVTFGLSPDRIKELLACRPAEGRAPMKPATPPMTKKERNRLSQAKWRKENPELARQRTRDCMRRRRATMRANGEKVR